MYVDRALHVAVGELAASASDEPLEPCAVALEQRVLVAVTRQAAVDALDAHAAALARGLRRRGSRAPRAPSRSIETARGLAGSPGCAAASPCVGEAQREGVELLTRERRDVHVHAVAQQRPALLDEDRLAGEEVAGRRERAAEPTARAPIRVADASAPARGRRPPPGGTPSARLRRPGSSPRGRRPRAAPRGCGRGSGGSRPGTDVAARSARSATAGRRLPGRRGSAPSRSPYAEQRNEAPIPSANKSGNGGRDSRTACPAGRSGAPSTLTRCRRTHAEFERGKETLGRPVINLAVVGYGYWGPNIVRNVMDRPELELWGLCEMNPERAAKFTRALPGRAHERELRRGARRPDRRRGVDRHPAATHYPLVKQALEAGKHVLVEKPLATSARTPRSSSSSPSAGPRARCPATRSSTARPSTRSAR